MEPIKILEQRFNLFPSKFLWRGVTFNVEAVTECKTVLAPSGRSEAYHFWVRVNGRLWHVGQWLTSGQWWLQPEGSD
jgi:hypothetical protein